MYSERKRENFFHFASLSRCSRAEREEVLVARKLRPQPRAPRPAQGRRLACASCSPGPLTGLAPRSATHVQFDPTHLLDADPLFVASRSSLLIRRRFSIKSSSALPNPSSVRSRPSPSDLAPLVVSFAGPTSLSLSDPTSIRLFADLARPCTANGRVHRPLANAPRVGACSPQEQLALRLLRIFRLSSVNRDGRTDGRPCRCSGEDQSRSCRCPSSTNKLRAKTRKCTTSRRPERSSKITSCVRHVGRPKFRRADLPLIRTRAYTAPTPPA